MSAQFEKAVEIVNSLPKDGKVKPTQEDQLYFYARFKQANVGDVNTPRPGMLDFVGKAKWDAWKAVEGKSKEEAAKEYVDKLTEMLVAADDEASKKNIEAIQAAA